MKQFEITATSLPSYWTDFLLMNASAREASWRFLSSDLLQLRLVCKSLFNIVHTINKGAFEATCSRIETDKNYRPNCTNQQLMDLVMKDGVSIHHPRRNAMMVKPVEESYLGKLYAVIHTEYGDPSGGYSACDKTWFINKMFLLVRFNASSCMCEWQTKDDANISLIDLDKKAILVPLPNLVEDYLGNRCLHDKEQGTER